MKSINKLELSATIVEPGKLVKMQRNGELTIEKSPTSEKAWRFLAI
jgi:hypothetical protein